MGPAPRPCRTPRRGVPCVPRGALTRAAVLEPQVSAHSGDFCARTLQCAGRDRGCATIYEVPAALAARGSGPRRPNCAASAPASTCGAMQGWRANGAPRRISARTRPGAFVLAHSDHVEPTTARFAGSWWRFGALAGHNALKIGHPASNCAVVLQVSAGFLSMPPTFCLKSKRGVRAESEVPLNALLMWSWVTKSTTLQLMTDPGRQIVGSCLPPACITIN